MDSRILPLILLAAVAACSDRPKPPPVPSGQAFQINPARWTQADVASATPRQDPAR